MLQFKATSNMADFLRLLHQTPEAMGEGVKSAMGDIKADWQKEARDIAPIDTGQLRQDINARVDGSGIEQGITIESNSYKNGFNYAYYIHEGHMAADGKQLRTPGTVEDYLNRSADNRADKWVDLLEDAVARELRRKGW